VLFLSWCLFFQNVVRCGLLSFYGDSGVVAGFTLVQAFSFAGLVFALLSLFRVQYLVLASVVGVIMEISLGNLSTRSHSRQQAPGARFWFLFFLHFYFRACPK
jgi:hypothetical protein